MNLQSSCPVQTLGDIIISSFFCFLTIMNTLFPFWSDFVSLCCVSPRVRETWESFLTQRFDSPRDQTLIVSPFPHILIVSICHTWSVSTESDAATWCNDALEHFLQEKNAILVSRCWVQQQFEKKTITTNIVQCLNRSILQVDTFYPNILKAKKQCFQLCRVNIEILHYLNSTMSTHKLKNSFFNKSKPNHTFLLHFRLYLEGFKAKL